MFHVSINSSGRPNTKVRCFAFRGETKNDLTQCVHDYGLPSLQLSATIFIVSNEMQKDISLLAISM